ncbi:MAG: hypothetical protein PHC86_00230 [Eubacteriales bacterium]|nr:hypothetical protein [Eubacteriales bacterium]
MKNVKIARKSMQVTILALSATLVMGLAACNVAPNGNQATVAQTATTVTATTVPANEQPAVAAEHTTELTASTILDSLSDADKTLTLVGYGAAGALSDEDLTVVDMLNYAIQDEYLAHGEYAKIIAEFGSANPYANIIRSEETHIDYLSEVFNDYGMNVPTDDSASHLVVPSSLLEAAQTGVQAEIDNIAMYEEFLGHALPLDVMDVFSALKTASESHLAAFEKQVNKLS